MTDSPLIDPRQRYPQPPFPRQPQPAPGLAQKMEPEPDHGEDTYTGHGKLTGRKVLITGGDSGIGRAAAIALGREGAEITLNYLESEQSDADDVKSLLEKDGVRIHQLPGDLTDAAFCRHLVQNAREGMGGLDTLIVNAAKQKRQDDVDAITDEQFDQTMKTNVYAMFWMTQEALDVIPPGGTIITVTSTQGFDPAPHLLDYATTKFAIRGFTQALSQAAIQKGIRVNGIAPGPFWTPLQSSGGQTQDKIEEFGASTPMGRPGQPAELGPAFVFLASNDSSYMTGEILGATGGKLIT